MAGRRILYLTGFLGCLAFYAFYRQWVSCLMLQFWVGLPWFSLILSLPAIKKTKLRFRCSPKVQVGTPVRTAMEIQCPFPPVPVRCRLRLCNLLTGQRFVGLPGEKLPTNRCGCMQLSWEKVYVYDYLGLFRFSARQDSVGEILITPKPVPGKLPQSLFQGQVHAWRPKPGGGFSENRELRLYRPGDSLHHIHWKLTAKVGKLVYAEPVEPVQQGILLTMSLFGDVENKLGRLLFFGGRLLEKQMGFQVLCHTGDGVVSFWVTDSQSFETGIEELLHHKLAAQEGEIPKNGAFSHHHIGGEQDEA